MKSPVSVYRWVKSNFSEVSPLISGWLSECVEDYKLSDEPNVDRDSENFNGYRLGQAVELLTRYRLFGYTDELLRSITAGFGYLEYFIDNFHTCEKAYDSCRYSRGRLILILSNSRDYYRRAVEIMKSGEFTDELIDLVLRLTNFINLGSGSSYTYFWDHTYVKFNVDTMSHVRIMVERSVRFLSSPEISAVGSALKLYGEEAFSSNIVGGVVDFYGEDCLVDLKCSDWSLGTNVALMQVITYLLLARYAHGVDKFRFGYVYNPRFDVVYKIDMSKIPAGLVDTIESRW